MFTDSHCHLDFPELASQLPDVLKRMEQAQVTRALCISVTMEEFPQVKALAERYPQLYATVGVHPDNLEARAPLEDELVEQGRHRRILAVGETGLDYFRLGEDPAARELAQERQQERFRTHIRAACRLGKPLVIHTRSASADTLRVMKEEGADRCSGVLHCFTESMAMARAAIELGFYISFSGIVTFKNAADLREVARYVPQDRLLIETDAPYLAPVPHRGKLNEPSFVPHTAELLARERGISIHAVAELTTDNFNRLFKPLEELHEVV
jgi:TatD DNase family protein